MKHTVKAATRVTTKVHPAHFRGSSPNPWGEDTHGFWRAGPVLHAQHARKGRAWEQLEPGGGVRS